VEIIQNQSPDGVLNPPLEIPDSEMRLDGYRWHPDLRPDRKGMGIDELFPPPPEGALEEVRERAPEEEAGPEKAKVPGTAVEMTVPGT